MTGPGTHLADQTAVKVLHVVHWPKSGITSFLRDFLNYQGDSRFNYHVLFFLADPEELLLFKSLCGSARSLNFEENRWKGLLKYRRIIRELSPDIIHTHSFQPGIWARIFAVGTRAKILSTIHSPYPYFREKGLLNRFKAFGEILSMNLSNSRTICVSEAVRQHLRENTNVKEGLLAVIRNGINTSQRTFDDLQMAKARREIEINGPGKIIITVGRLSEEKGIDILLSAFSEVLCHTDNVLLAIVGAGPLENGLKKQAVDLDIQEKVRFLGFKMDVFPYLAVSSLYASAARFEGLSMSLIEALAAGVPVVATRVGGIPEVIEDRVTGVLVEPENPRFLAQAMLDLLDSRTMTDRLRENGLKRVAEHFDISRTVQDYEKLYVQCLSGGKRQGPAL